MYSDVDIIVAAATPPRVRSALAIVRVSGSGCWQILSQFFKQQRKTPLRPWRAVYGYWVDEKGVVDDVVVTPFQAPRSYTGQDMFEISCHGNPLFVEAIVDGLVRRGVRRAKPGEFTMRAVLNGRMDLLAAEAVNGLIEAHTRFQADVIRRQATGPLVSTIQKHVETILQIQSHIEASIDYGEEDIDALDREAMAHKLKQLIKGFQQLSGTADFAAAMRRGFRVLLTGEPNVGKSTLFNALVREERAIVTEIPGTTRDLISEQIEIQGLPVVLIDSAGVRETADQIEAMGIEKIYQTLESVDLVLALTQAGQDGCLYQRLKDLPQEKILRVETKADLSKPLAEHSLALSATTGEGLARLEQEIVLKLSSGFEVDSLYLINKRQQETVLGVIGCLEQAYEDFLQGFGEEILSAYLNTARHLLGELTGETSVEDILDRMFSNFCLGK